MMLFLQMLEHLVKWHCDYFFFVFQMIEHNSQQQRLKLDSDFFIIFCRFFFNGVSRFFTYSSSFSRQHSVSGWWVKCCIIFLMFCVVAILNWDRDCNMISIRVRSISVLFAKFVNSTNSVGHSGIRTIFLRNVEIMRFGW